MKSNDLPRCRILIVDTCVEMLALMAGLFRPYGFDLVVTSSAVDAVRQAQEFMPHAVYMGLEYEDCDGWELAARLREVPGMSRVMLVGLVAREKKWRPVDSTGNRGFDYYFPKPPRMQDIVRTLTNGAF